MRCQSLQSSIARKGISHLEMNVRFYSAAMHSDCDFFLSRPLFSCDNRLSPPRAIGKFALRILRSRVDPKKVASARGYIVRVR